MRRVTLMLALSLIALPLAFSGLHAADLEDVFDLALENDPRFAGMRYEKNAEQEKVQQAWGGVLPTLSAEGAYKETRQDIISTDNEVYGTGTSDYPTTEYTLSLTQPIFDFASFVKIKGAKADLRGAEFELAAARQKLAVRVAGAYFGVLAARDRLRVTSAEETAVNLHYELVKEKFNRGLAPRTDYYESKARLAEVKTKRLEAESDLEDARQAMEEIIGVSAGSLVPLQEELPLISPEPVNADAWIEASLKQNPALKAVQQSVEAAEQEIRRQRAGHYPDLELEANYNWQETEGTLFGGGSEVGTADVGLRLSVPIFQGGIVRSRTREATQRKKAVRQEEVRQKRALEREASAAFYGVGNAIERVKSLREAVEAQRLALEGKKDGYESGLFTILAVLDAERDLSLARQNYAMARYEYVLNTLILKKTAGTLSDKDIAGINGWLSHSSE